MKLLLHTCCGPCSVYPLDKLMENKDLEITGVFYNPNIHPYTEYKLRLESAEKLYDIKKVKFMVMDGYDLKYYMKKLSNFDDRCVECYEMRLDKIARYAKENLYDMFSTTLLVSPYQRHEEIQKVCMRLQDKYDIEFYYEDFRPGFREGQSKARELGLYMQKYCGCIFSEEERYRKQILKDKEKKEKNYKL